MDKLKFEMLEKMKRKGQGMEDSPSIELVKVIVREINPPAPNPSHVPASTNTTTQPVTTKQSEAKTKATPTSGILKKEQREGEE